MTRRARRKLGLRGEIEILPPVAVFVLAIVAVFTLLSYRRAVGDLIRERQGEARESATAVARAVARATDLPVEQLAALAPSARRIAVLDAGGLVLSVSGAGLSGDPLAPLGGRALGTEVVALGPNRSLPDSVVGFAAAGRGTRRRIVRVDLPAGTLGAQHRTLPILTGVVAGSALATILLVLLFLRHLLAPYERLLARARETGGDTSSDETTFLVETFERAVAALAREREGSDEIAALSRTLAPQLESGLLLLDAEGRVLALNSAGRSLLAVEPHEGVPASELLADHPALRDLIVGAVAEGIAVQRRECPLVADGTERTLGLSVHPLRRDDRRLRGHLVLFADLTQARREAAAERLAESLSRLGELAAGVAHELRNSLATLRGYLALIERNPEDSPADYLAEIRRESEHLERVLDDFLTFAQPGSARLEDVDLLQIARRAAADPALGGRPVEVVDRSGDGGGRVRGDAQLLERALRNLLHNAVEAQGQAGGGEPVRVVLGGSRETGSSVAIEDRGPGLPDAVRERLFQPFVVGRPGGVGLGLALAYRIVDLHGGHLELVDRPGGGTTAEIRFPAGEIG